MNPRMEEELGRDFPDRLTWQKTIPTFHPETSDESAEIFRRASRFKQKVYICGFGNNIDPVGGKFADLLVVKSDRLNQIINIGADDFYVTVGAGYPVKEVNKVLEEYNLWFPYGETNYPGSFGGALAAGLYGHDNDHEVPFSRTLLSVKAVLPDGTTVTPGALTFKSVSGYDISRLFYNSWGTVGFLVELSFRVLPLSKKEETQFIRIENPDYEKFKKILTARDSQGELSRKIKAEYDPEDILPLL